MFRFFFIAGILFFFFKKPEGLSPKLGSIVESVYGLGTVHAERSYNLKIGITSAIRKIYTKEGEIVQKGQSLIELDSIPVFKAPFTGTITAIPFEEREIVFPQVPILKMEDFSEVFLKVSLEQQGALRVKKGQPARILFESMRGTSFNGKVRSIFPDEGQFMVYISIEDLPTEILPGMTADVAIETGKKENALLIPTSVFKAGQVIRVRNGKKEKIKVKLGVLNGEWAEIIEGDIKLEDQVLVPKS